MAIEKNNVKVAASKLDTEFSIGNRSRDSMSIEDDDELRDRNSVDSEDDDADSGAGSDDFDLLELGETGSEFCQVGDQTCCIPFELYDLNDLSGILSLDVWNECLTEEERFSLTKYLPDMDQEMFMRTLKELFDGGNFHFGNPVDKLYQMLKGGLCEPRVALYRQGLNFFQKHQHYHSLHKRQDSMVGSFLQMRETWEKCKGYGIEEKLRLLNIVRRHKSLTVERNDVMGSDSSDDREESGGPMWNTRPKARSSVQKVIREPFYGTNPALDIFSHGRGAVGNSTKSPLQNELAQRDWNVSQGNMMDQVQTMKRGKKRVAPIGGEYAHTNVSSHGRNLNINQLSDIKVLTSKPSNVRDFYDPSKRAKYGEPMYKDQLEPVRDRASQMAMKRNLGHYADVGEPYWSKKTQRQAYFTEPSFDYDIKDGETRKMKVVNQVPNYRSFPEKRSNVLQDNTRGLIARHGGSSMFPLMNEKMKSMNHGGEDTESDSSDQLEEGDRSHLIMKNRALHGYLETPGPFSGYGHDKRSVRGNSLGYEGMQPVPNMTDFGRHVRDQEFSNYYLKSRQGAKTQQAHASQNFTGMIPENPYYGDLGNNNAERNRISATLGRMGQMQGVPLSMNNAFPFEGRVRGNVGHETLSRKSKHLQEYTMVENGVRYVVNPMRRGNRTFDATLTGCTLNAMKHKRKEGFIEIDGEEGSDYMQSHQPNFEDFSLKNSGKRRREDNGSLGVGSSEQPVTEVTVVEDLEPEIKPPKKPAPLITPTIHTDFSFSIIHLLTDVRVSLTSPYTEESSDAQKKLETPGAAPEEQSSKHEQTNGSLEQIDVNNPANPEQASVQTAKQEQTNGSPKQIDVNNPADPEQISVNSLTVHEDQKAKKEQANGSLEQIDVNNPALPEKPSVKQEQINGSLEQIDVNKLAEPELTRAPSLTVHEIVNRVRSNPWDPKILETQEPLQDLIRGVLKVFSTKAAPLGTKGWKPLITYDKSTKRWSWSGPDPQTPTESEPVTSPEAWGIPRKMLVKLVDAFANWLKCGQETLRQIGSLPAPPAELMQLNFDEKERFKDLRAQKSLPTFSPSTDETRAYFRKEEHLRYSVPDRAFSYTAADGKKSIVAPLRRCGGKPTSKARDHFMLKPDRPPHVTILCLVRDAAARLPGSIGTRADVCTLIRDSQYMVEDVSDAQVNQVVSGALDRLHYERDPCVQFESERKLWVYLHSKREEEDFEDDGTSSTKKWKRQKKDPSEQDDQVTVACPENVESTALDPSSDLNAQPSCPNEDKIAEPTCVAGSTSVT